MFKNRGTDIKLKGTSQWLLALGTSEASLGELLCPLGAWPGLFVLIPTAFLKDQRPAREGIIAEVSMSVPKVLQAIPRGSLQTQPLV